MLKLSGSALPVLRRASGGIRRSLPSSLYVPAAAACLPLPTTCGGGPRTRQGQARPSSSSSRWKARQESDQYAREAKVKDLKSRAAFKLLQVRQTHTKPACVMYAVVDEVDEDGRNAYTRVWGDVQINRKYKLFKKGSLVLDLGYAPGSWCQVAMELTKPTGRVLGVDLIPAQPPRGVGTLQGNFLSPTVRRMTKQLIAEMHHRQVEDKAAARRTGDGADDDDVVADRPSYIDMEHRASKLEVAVESAQEAESSPSSSPSASSAGQSRGGRREEGEAEAPAATTKPEEKKYLDIVLSDMLMNTSGIPFRDHAGSMDLCTAALDFANETLRPGGHFVCKFYQGAEDKDLERRLKKLFLKVYREKPESSRDESKEMYFVAMNRRPKVDLRETGGA
ncbi:hypothetical protein RB594_005730 [Gaeumannomyces avenae]